VLDSRLAPIGTTTGAPRFPRSIGDRAEFEAAYRARLERFGIDKIRRVLEAFASVVPPHDVLGVVARADG
jgi:hypothetical protein